MNGMPKYLKTVTMLTALVVVACLSGCAATEVALEHRDLQVSTRMSSTVFLDVENGVEKTVYLDVRNTSDKDIDVKSLIASRLAGAGYTVVSNPRDAFYVLQMNVLQVGVASPSALHQSLYAGWGGTLGGAEAGALIGGQRADSFSGAMNGAGIGGLVGSAAELVAGSMVKNVTFSMITDLQILERTKVAVKQSTESNLASGTGTHVTQESENTTNWKKYQTRIVSTANQVNLKFAKALPVLEEQLAKSVAGIF